MTRQAKMITAALCCAMLAVAHADMVQGQIALSPGHWESSSNIEVTIIAPDQAETRLPAQADVREQCLKAERAVLNPVDLAGPGCEVISSETTETGLYVDLKCSRDDGEYIGWVKAETGETGVSTVAELELSTLRSDGSQRIIRANLSSRRSGPCL